MSITIKGAPASAEQRKILRRAMQLADRWGAPYKAKVALVEALIQESEAQNLSTPSADGYGSYGVLQGLSRFHKHSDLMDPAYQIGIFLGKGRGGKRFPKGFTGKGNAISLAGSGMRSGDIAQRVEGSAYPERYQTSQKEAQRIVAALSGRQVTGGVSASRVDANVSRAGVSEANPVMRQQALQLYLSQRGRPGALLALKSQLDAASAGQPVQAVSSASQTSPQRSGTEPTASSSFAQTARERANIIDRKHLPYLWGGGHGGKVDPRKATPLDCSGAVSSVLGINPRVSGDFAHWGSPGRAPGGKGVTVYSNPHHVLMEIDGHFWGTSASNPGKGAGWIPRSQISPEYLKGFVARHTKR